MALTLPSLPAGHVPTAAEYLTLMAAITQAYGIRATKASDTTITSSTTLTDDPELSVAVAASTIYKIHAVLYLFGASAGDFKGVLTWPSGTCLSFGGFGLTTGSVGASTAADIDAQAFGSDATSPSGTRSFGVPDTNGAMVTLEATISVSTTPGNIVLQWAQNASSGTGTTVKAGSWMHAYAD